MVVVASNFAVPRNIVNGNHCTADAAGLVFAPPKTFIATIPTWFFLAAGSTFSSKP